MVVKSWVMLLPLIGLLSACAAVPTGPSVMVLPGVGKPFDQFQVDDMGCQQFAQAQTGLPPGEAGRQSTTNTAVLGTLLGAGAGAVLGAAAGDAGVGTALGAGSGLLFGTASGAEAGAGTSRSLQRRYDISYMQCMYAKGHQLPGTQTAPQSSDVPPPPGTPPPPSAGPRPPATVPPPRGGWQAGPRMHRTRPPASACPSLAPPHVPLQRKALTATSQGFRLDLLQGWEGSPLVLQLQM
jgi:hypothetical protein